mgnify:CR=1 FL=1
MCFEGGGCKWWWKKLPTSFATCRLVVSFIPPTKMCSKVMLSVIYSRFVVAGILGGFSLCLNWKWSKACQCGIGMAPNLGWVHIWYLEPRHQECVGYGNLVIISYADKQATKAEVQKGGRFSMKQTWWGVLGKADGWTWQRKWREASRLADKSGRTRL